MGLAVSFTLVFTTGIIKYPGLIQSLGVDYGLIPMGEISILHEWSGILMGSFVFLHLMLHRKWIIYVTKKYFRKEVEK